MRVTIFLLQVANAGVGEIGNYFTPKVKGGGKLEKPAIGTVDVNLLGTIYSKCNLINDIRDTYLPIPQPHIWPSTFWSLRESQKIH